MAAGEEADGAGRLRVALAGALVLALVGVAAGAVGAPGAGSAAAAQRSSGEARLPVVPRHGRPFVPAVGDWEGVADGVPASFEVAYRPQFASGSRPPYGYRDLTMLLPDYDPELPGCPLTPRGSTTSVISEAGFAPFGAGGSFPLARDELGGGLRGPHSALLTLAQKPFTAIEAPCVHTWRWTMRPADRRRVYDGEWKLRFADGEQATFTVGAGGRIADGVPLARALRSCAGPAGGVSMFIAASGVASFSEGEEGVTARIEFTKPQAATGAISAGQCSVALSASLTRRAH